MAPKHDVLPEHQALATYEEIHAALEKLIEEFELPTGSRGGFGLGAQTYADLETLEGKYNVEPRGTLVRQLPDFRLSALPVCLPCLPATESAPPPLPPPCRCP